MGWGKRQNSLMCKIKGGVGQQAKLLKTMWEPCKLVIVRNLLGSALETHRPTSLCYHCGQLYSFFLISFCFWFHFPPKVGLTSPLRRQARSIWNINTTCRDCRFVLIRRRFLFSVIRSHVKNYSRLDISARHPCLRDIKPPRSNVVTTNPYLSERGWH